MKNGGDGEEAAIKLEDVEGEDAAGDEENAFAALPDELVLSILDYLTLGELLHSATLVSKRFRRLALDPALGVWTDFEVPKTMAPDAACQTVTRAKLLRRLIVERRQADDYSGAEVAALAVQSCKRLEHLEVSAGAADGGAALFEAVAGSTALRALHLLNGSYDAAALLAKAATTVSRLTELALFNCRTLKSEGLRTIGEICTDLRHINIEEVTQIEDASFNEFFTARMGTLEVAHIDGESMTDKSFVSLGMCRNLTRLAIRLTLQICP